MFKKKTKTANVIENNAENVVIKEEDLRVGKDITPEEKKLGGWKKQAEETKWGPKFFDASKEYENQEEAKQRVFTQEVDEYRNEEQQKQEKSGEAFIRAGEFIPEKNMWVYTIFTNKSLGELGDRFEI